MTVKAYGKSCKAAYRTCALRVLSAFRTVSDDAALVLAGMIPLDLLAEEARCSGDPTSKRDATMTKWQERWRATANGSWTKRIVPDIRPWCLDPSPDQPSATDNITLSWHDYCCLDLAPMHDVPCTHGGRD
ncbi:hypothetical protein ACLKA6_000695 [Drosophila palustris]